MATRMDIARAVAEKENISIQDANNIIGTTIDVIGKFLKKEDVTLVGLGTLRRALLKARKGRNPKTGEAIDIPEKTVVRFKPSKNLIPAPEVRAARSPASKPAGKRGKSKRTR